MRTIVFSAATPPVVLAVLAAVFVAGCTGDDTNAPAPPGSDAGADVTVPSDSGGQDSAAPDAASLPPDLLLSYEFENSQSAHEIEFGAFDLGSATEVGHLQYPAGFAGGTNVSTSAAPWVLQQANDIVMRMDPTHPWIPTSTWSVASPQDGGYAYTDPSSVAETATTAYVPLYNRDHIAVLDTTAVADGGAPSTTIDLSALQQSGDTDGTVEATAAFYDPSTKYVWVVLQNIDEDTVTAASNYNLLCVPGLTSTVIAIDTTSGGLVSGKTYTLHGVDPVSSVFDAANERLLLLNAGCYDPSDAGADAGPGPLVGRLVEALDLTSGVSTVLYDGTSQGYPGSLVYVDAHHAFVSFSGATYAWDPTTMTLGETITNAPDVYVWDGKGLLGPKTSFLDDGGVAEISVIEVSPANVVTAVGMNPVTEPQAGGFWTGADLWPHP
jgi:hypothetical protein